MTLNELTSKDPVDLGKMSICLTNIIRSHHTYTNMSERVGEDDYLYNALQSNNEHNEALIAILNQLITKRQMDQSLAPKAQIPAPVVENRSYDKQYGTAYDFAAMMVPKRGE